MRVVSLLTAIVTALVSFTASAQSSSANVGYNVFTCDVSVLPLEEGHSIIVWKGKGITLGTPDKTWHMSQLECVSTTEVFPDKSFKMNGYCAHVDRDGDRWIDHNWRDSTTEKGRYETKGISGKYEGGVETGSFVPTDLPTPGRCTAVSSWEADR